MRIILIAIGLLVSSFAFSQSSTKPGLWEITSKMSSPTNPQLAKQMEEAQKAIAAMPPEQRKQMEEMMTKQGMNMSFARAAQQPSKSASHLRCPVVRPWRSAKLALTNFLKAARPMISATNALSLPVMAKAR